MHKKQKRKEDQILHDIRMRLHSIVNNYNYVNISVVNVLTHLDKNIEDEKQTELFCEQLRNVCFRQWKNARYIKKKVEKYRKQVDKRKN